jgi:hypothetical protein
MPCELYLLIARQTLILSSSGQEQVQDGRT